MDEHIGYGEVVFEIVDRSGKVVLEKKFRNYIAQDLSKAIVNALSGNTPVVEQIDVVRLNTSAGTVDLTPTVSVSTVNYGYRVEIYAEDSSSNSYTVYSAWVGNSSVPLKYLYKDSINISKPSDKKLRITWRYYDVYRIPSGWITF